MGQSLEAGQAHTAERFSRIEAALLSPAADGGDSCEVRYGPRATVYATGSYGRGEASEHSDLDLFIVSAESPAADDGKLGGPGSRRQTEPMLKNLDQICLKAQLIELTRSLGLPEFSGGGKYLECYTGSQLANAIGSDDDDYLNTFTARLLLLLESRPLMGRTVYAQAVETVIWAYFGDYEDHSLKFQPTFLVNDILRLWRTFCVNYENRTSDADEAAKAKRKLTHYKLSHSRLLTCYSGIVTLLATYRRKGTVSPGDVLELVAKTPRERIKEVGKVSPRSAKTATEVLDSYELFLDRTDVDEPALRQQFLDKTYARERMEEARQFAELIHDFVSSIDAGRLSRAIVV